MESVPMIIIGDFCSWEMSQGQNAYHDRWLAEQAAEKAKAADGD